MGSNQSLYKNAPSADQYTLIGEGSWCRVYRNKDVIRKIYIRPISSQDNDFFREMRFYAWLEHNNPAVTNVPFSLYDSFSHLIRSEVSMVNGDMRGEIYATYVGEPVTPAAVAALGRYAFATMALRFVKEMPARGIVHVDLHRGNFVVRNSTLNLVDYGQVYFEGEATYHKAVRENTMMMQIIVMMINYQDVYEALQKRRIPVLDTNVVWQYIEATHPVIVARVLAFLEANGLALRVSEQDAAPMGGYTAADVGKLTDVAGTVADNMLRLLRPDVYATLYMLDELPPMHFPAEDILFMHDNFRDIDKICAYLDGQAKRKKDANK